MRRQLAFVVADPWLSIVIIAAACGIVCRFGNLSGKVYWGDEVTSSVRATGHTWADVFAFIDGTPTMRIADTARFMRMDADRGLGDTVRSLATEDPHHPPLYYVLLRGWLRVAGDGVSAARAFSAILGIGAIGYAYVAMRSLGDDRRAALAAAALLAVSPYHVVYSQEAREYALWTLLTLASLAAFGRASATSGRRAWMAYTSLVALGLYTHLFFFTVPLSLLIQGVASRGGRRHLRSHAIALATAIALFLPWALVVRERSSVISDAMMWTKVRLPLHVWLSEWVRCVGLPFVDLQRGYLDPAFPQWSSAWPPGVPLGIATLALVVAGLGWASRRGELARVGPLVALIIVPTLTLAAADIVRGGRLLTLPRYQVPAMVALVLLAASIGRAASATVRGRCALAAVGIVAAASSLSYATEKNWWNKYHGYVVNEVARIVTQLEPKQILMPPSRADMVLSLAADGVDGTLRVVKRWDAETPGHRDLPILLVDAPSSWAAAFETHCGCHVTSVFQAPLLNVSMAR